MRWIVIRVVNYFSDSALHGAQLSSCCKKFMNFLFFPLLCEIWRCLENNNNNPNLFQICKNVIKIETVLFAFWFSSMYFLLKYMPEDTA